MPQKASNGAEISLAITVRRLKGLFKFMVKTYLTNFHSKKHQIKIGLWKSGVSYLGKLSFCKSVFC